MNRLDTSACAGGNILFTKSGTFDFLQDANKEMVEQTLIALLGFGITSGTGPVILWGCGSNTVGGTTSVNMGAIYVPSGYFGTVGNLGGEVILVDQQAIPVTTGVLLANLSTTPYTTNADPTDFSDSVSRNVHNIRRITFSYGTTHTGTGFYSPFDYSELTLNPSTPIHTSDPGSLDGATISLTRDQTIDYAGSAIHSNTVTFDFYGAKLFSSTIITVGVVSGASLTLVATGPLGSSLTIVSGAAHAASTSPGTLCLRVTVVSALTAIVEVMNG
jgi:hypothetical protein